MRIVFFSAALLASSLATAATPIPGWYGSLFGGYNFIPDNIKKIQHNTLFGRAVYHNSYNAGGRFGFQSTPMRYEAEFTYINSRVSSFRANRHRFLLLQGFRRYHDEGQNNAYFAMANVYYDFPEMIPCIYPYLGAGIGYAFVDATFRSRDVFHPLRFSGSDSAFAYQGTAGLTYNFAENWALNIAYRYVGTTTINALGKVFQGNLGSVGVVYRFNEYYYK